MKPFILATILLFLIRTPLIAQTLVFCSEGAPTGFDPALHTSVTTFDASSRTIYDRLVDHKPGTTEIIPSLAESWEFKDDGKAIIFNLRQDVTFHANDTFTPSRNFNADDVVFSLNRQQDPQNPYYEVSGGTWDYFNGMSLQNLIESVSKVDDYTVQVTLKVPEVTFLPILAMDFASIVSKEYADAMLASRSPTMLDTTPIGTGPFRFVSFDNRATIRFERHDTYWQKPPLIDTLIFAVSPGSFSRYKKLNAGECDVIAYPNLADVPEMEANEDIVVIQHVDLNIGYLAYNTQVPPFDNAQVRKALNMAINKQAIVETVFGGTGVIAKNPFPASVWAYDSDTIDDPYDPSTARSMLVDQGILDLRMKIWAMPVFRPYNPDSELMATMIKNDLNQIGVEVEIVSYDWEEYLDRSQNIDRDGAVLLGWTGDNGDPENFLSPLLDCHSVERTNIAQWCDEDFNGALEKARLATSQEDRGRHYRKAQEIFKREAPWATIAHSIQMTAMRRNVVDYVMHPLGGHDFRRVGILE